MKGSLKLRIERVGPPEGLIVGRSHLAVVVHLPDGRKKLLADFNFRNHFAQRLGKKKTKYRRRFERARISAQQALAKLNGLCVPPLEFNPEKPLEWTC